MIHVNRALKNCRYSEWALARGAASPKQKDSERKEDDTTRKHQTVFTYINGFSAELCRTIGAHRVDAYFTPRNTLRQIFMPTRNHQRRRKWCDLSDKL